MSRFEKLTHVIWHCQYHIIWVPKYRFRVLQGEVACEVHNCVQIYSSRQNCQVVELNVQPDHTTQYEEINHKSILTITLPEI